MPQPRAMLMSAHGGGQGCLISVCRTIWSERRSTDRLVSQQMSDSSPGEECDSINMDTLDPDHFHSLFHYLSLP